MTTACLVIGGILFGFALLLIRSFDTNYRTKYYTESEREEYNKAFAEYYRALADLYDADSDTK